MGKTDLRKVLDRIQWEKYMWTSISEQAVTQDDFNEGAITALNNLEDFVVDLMEQATDAENPVQ